MKKFTFLMCVVLACLLNANAQEPQFVSKEQQNKNVLIEELTGRNCGYCPAGHVAVNQFMKENPGRVVPINIHAQSGLSPTSYPNLNTQYGYDFATTLAPNSGIPTALVNRAHPGTVHPADAQCANILAQQLGQTAEVNIAGQVRINHETRLATIKVEVYYTADSKESANYLTIAMLQDSILGAQADYENFNPDQMIGKLYVHMHTLRDVITDAWGDEIAPTKAGSLITKTYEYQIPETIGNPNGVEVDLDNVHFVAFVAEKKEGIVSRPVLNVAELHTIRVKDAAVFTYFDEINVKSFVSCSTIKPATLKLVNGGTENITSIKYESEVKGVVNKYSWEGSLPSYSEIIFEEELDIPFGKQNVRFSITEVNDKPYEYTQDMTLNSEGWTSAYFQADEDEFKIDIVQDKYGSQITWEFIDADNNVLASGGPYTVLVGNNIKMHRTKVKVQNNACYRFVINDEGGNGINCGFGEGYYKITDSKGYVIVESDGKFTNQEYHNISTNKGYASVDEMTNESYNIYPNPVDDILTIVGNNIKQVNVYNTMGQLVKTAACENSMVNISVEDLQNGMYIVNVIDNNGEVSSRKVTVL